jgi:hypothetical protein
MATFPQDQFDRVPAELKRVGAHRAPAKRGRGWIAFAWGALATGVLVIGGLYGLSRVNPDIAFELPNFGGGEEPAPSASPSTSMVPPITDPAQVPEEVKVTISVFNASSTDGLQNVAADAVKDAGWPNPARFNATKRDQSTTTVYYRSADYEGIARGMVELLGVGKVVLSDAFPGAPITIVVGEDYATVAGNTAG